MRKVILAINTTLNGIVTEELSWMKPDTNHSWNSFFEMLANVDLLLLGSGMWKDYRNFWSGVLKNEAEYTKNEVKYAQYAAKTKHLIFSSKLNNTGWNNASVVSGDLNQIIQNIMLKDGKDIQIVGGANFASGFINSGLVDEYRIMVNPVIIGQGKSLWSEIVYTQSLECISTELLDNGVLVLCYKRVD